jgi:hypothetical protein
MSKGVDTLRYSHTLSNGEDLVLSMAFSKDIENEDAFIARCQYMYKTMSNAIYDHELRFGLKNKRQTSKVAE